MTRHCSNLTFAHRSNIGTTPLVSVVVPCFNEEAVLQQTNCRLKQVLEQLPVDFEIIYVDDGSDDSTPELLRQFHADDVRVRVIQLSRNFGHQVAITAGLEHTLGEAVLLIDADMQDPPEVIPEMISRWADGCDVAYGIRTERAGETSFKLWTAKWFYKLIDILANIKIPIEAGDFRLMDRKVVDAVLEMPERDRFLRGMVSWVGFKQVAVPYRRASRLAGTTKYPLSRMVRLALDGILSFSVLPLRLAMLAGFSVSALAVIGAVIALSFRLFTNRWVTGWTSLLLAILFMGGVQLVCVGIIGEYLGRIYGESKHRPLYFVQQKLGFGGQKLGARQRADGAKQTWLVHG